MELRKRAIGMLTLEAGWKDADTVSIVKGYMSQGANASPGAVPRSRRTQCTSGNFMHENRETSAMPNEPVRKDSERRPRP